MPACENCGAVVSADYARVFARDSDDVGCCPRCPDMTRRNGKPTPARGSRCDARAVDETEVAVDGE